MAAETHYEILGVQATATAKEIRTAYHQQAKRYHADRVEGHGLGELGPEFMELAHQRMKEINAAYDVLKDPQKRVAYDRKLTEHRQAEEALRRYEEERWQQTRQQAEEERRRREAEARATEERRRREEEEERQRWGSQRQAQEQEAQRRKAARIAGVVLALMPASIGIWVLLWYLITPPAPDFVGSTLVEAAEKAAHANRKIAVYWAVESSKAKGTIDGQYPRPNQRPQWPRMQRDVELYISGGRGKVGIPDVSGLSESQACKALTKAGLDPRLPHFYPCVLEVDRSGEMVSTAGGPKVTGTDPPAGKKVWVGNAVDLVEE